MADYRHGAHSVFEIHLHPVRTTRYRKPVLVGPVGLRLRELIREICGAADVHTLRGHVSKDHVHLLVAIPDVAASDTLELMGRHVLPALRHEAMSAAGGGGGEP